MKLNRYRLGLRLAIAVFLSILTVEAIVLVPSYKNYHEDLLSRLEHAGRATAIAVLSLQAHGSDRAALINARIMASRSDDFVGGALYDAEGTLIGTFGEAMTSELDPNSSVSVRRLTDNGRRLEALWTSADTGLSFTLIGRLDADWIGAELTAFVWRILGLVLIISAVVCGATLLIFHRAVLSPLRDLRDRLVAARGSPTRPEPYIMAVDRADELGDVMRAFNAMLRGTADNIAALEVARKKLADAKDDLEQTVEERTRELQSANTSLTKEVAERERAENQLRHDAFHDRLTGLANRSLLIDRLDQAISRAHQDDTHSFALLVLNVDRFRKINDSLGHVAGDEVLRVISKRLLSTLQPGDTAARTAGDEFAMLIENVTSPKDAARRATQIQDLLAEPVTVEGEQVYCAFSIGIALSLLDYVQAESLIQDAKIALVHARESGRGRFALFDQPMRSGDTGQLRIETDLRRAIDQGDQLELHYQPIVEARSGRTCFLEALIRWEHPTRGLMSPAEFIPLAEETALIIPIGDWALLSATTQLKRWQTEIPGYASLGVSVNASSRQLTDQHLRLGVEAALEQSRIDPNTLKLEVTESLLMSNPELASHVLDQLKDLGVQLAIDDFGTGYSSLSYLRLFPFDILKIDRLFVRDMSEGRESREIVRTIVDLAKVLGLEVVAEGIETPEQAQTLRDLGCDYLQGYYFSVPLPVEEATKHLIEQSERMSARSEQALRSAS